MLLACTRTLLTINLHYYSVCVKLRGFGTLEQLKQGQGSETLHTVAELKFSKKCFHRYFDSLFLILIG